ncbi:MAG: hypothetical protein JWR80_4073 [Bradyrhizobium sp.]|nr:hypothetical protein [Bradyrhizobium sp.]
MLRVLEYDPAHRMEWDKFRIIDFYYLFPHLLAVATLPRALTGRKNAYGKTASPYNRIPAPRALIQQMASLHAVIARSLAAKGFLISDDLSRGILTRTEKSVPTELSKGFAAASADEPLVRMLAEEVAAIPLNGAGGLKERTGLLEHRYGAS